MPVLRIWNYYEFRLYASKNINKDNKLGTQLFMKS
jgi:hypothetical protein